MMCDNLQVQVLYTQLAFAVSVSLVNVEYQVQKYYKNYSMIDFAFA